MKIAVINGPNLNLLGTRDPELYGKETLDEIIAKLEAEASKSSIEVSAYQSNSEGALVDAIQKAGRDSGGIIINAAAYTHTSVALRDALEAVQIPVVEVHLTNIYSREAFRRHSLLSSQVDAVIAGFGASGYLHALNYLRDFSPR